MEKLVPQNLCPFYQREPTTESNLVSIRTIYKFILRLITYYQYHNFMIFISMIEWVKCWYEFGGVLRDVLKAGDVIEAKWPGWSKLRLMTLTEVIEVKRRSRCRLTLMTLIEVRDAGWQKVTLTKTCDGSLWNSWRWMTWVMSCSIGDVELVQTYKVNLSVDFRTSSWLSGANWYWWQ